MSYLGNPDDGRTTSDLNTAEKKLEENDKRLQHQLGLRNTYTGELESARLQRGSNIFHYFAFAVIFAVAVALTIRTFTTKETNAIETLILAIACLLLLYYAIDYVIDYFR